MKKLIRNWLLGDLDKVAQKVIREQIQESLQHGSLSNSIQLQVENAIIRIAKDDAGSTWFDRRFSCHLDTVTKSVTDKVKETVSTEEFIDKIIERIKRKQL